MFRLFLITLSATTAAVPAVAFAQAAAPVLPTGGSVAGGTVAIGAPEGGAMRIVQGSDRAIVNWQGFSIGEGGRVDIAQPNARAALLNRVTSGATSEIAGQLNANGRVFLVNPNGILITRTGSVTAAGFTASTLDIADRDFMAGSDDLGSVGGSDATVSVRRASGGYAGLLDGQADDSGYVQARLVSDKAGAGALDLTGDGFMQVAVPTGGISVAGRITAQNVVLRTGTAREAVRGTVNLTGTIRAVGVESRGGTVVLTGDTVNLAGATVDASGAAGGGRVRIGGDWHGGDGVARATALTVDAGTTIAADATGTGDGGSVVLWSDAATRFAGAIRARGAGEGVGGDAEVSGKAWLDYAGTTDLTGARFGTLLLDPYNVTISNAAQTTGNGFTAARNDSVINATTLQNALSTANVTVSTGSGGDQRGDITVAAPVSWTSGSRLTLDAAGAITFTGVVVNVRGGGQVTLNYSPAANPTTGGLVFAQNSALTFSNNAGQSSQALVINGQNYRLLRSFADLASTNGAGQSALAFNIYTSGNKSGNLIRTLTGTLEGLGHITDGYRTSGTALIGEIAATGSVRNIGILDGSVGGTTRTGNLASINRGSIYNASTTNPGNGSFYVGGLVGENRGLISNSFTTNSVNGTSYVGGLVGINYGTIRDSYTTGSVNGSSNVGGIAGLNKGTVTNSTAYGRVSGGGGGSSLWRLFGF